MSPAEQHRRRVTLARALSKSGWTSRSLAEELIAQGRVRLNGRVARSSTLWVDPLRDRIEVDGEQLRKRSRLYLAMNKPAGVVTTREDECGRSTVYHYLPEDVGWLFPVGRLDKETSGLLLFTNDTRFGEQVTSPLSKIPKTYAVRLNRPLSEHDRARLHLPLRLDDGTTFLPAKIASLPTDKTSCKITLCEGKNREVRRTFEFLGYKVVALQRVSIGSLRIGRLKEGQVRRLSEQDIRRILRRT